MRGSSSGAFGGAAALVFARALLSSPSSAGVALRFLGLLGCVLLTPGEDGCCRLGGAAAGLNAGLELGLCAKALEREGPACVLCVGA